MDLVPSTDGVVVALHDLGGSGDPLLLVHATGFCGGIWEPLAAHLDGFRCWAPDVRGHGRSRRPEGADLDWRRAATDVLATVDHLGGAPLPAVGHSMGGACLLLAELARPGTFTHLYLYDPVVPIEVPEAGGSNRLAEGARRRRDTFPSRSAAYDNFASKPPFDVLAPESLRAYVEHGFEQLEDGAVRLRCRPEVEASVYEAAVQHRAADRLGEVGCPVTVAHGRHEEEQPSEWAPEVARRLPRGREVVFEHLGHFGPLEEPSTVAASVLDALSTG